VTIFRRLNQDIQTSGFCCVIFLASFDIDFENDRSHNFPANAGKMRDHEEVSGGQVTHTNNNDTRIKHQQSRYTLNEFKMS